MFLQTDVFSWVLPIVLGVSIGFMIAFARKKKSGGGLLYLEADEFRKNMRRGQLIDIRREEDFSKEKINGSRNYPKKSIFQNLYHMRSDQAIFLYDNADTAMAKKVGKKLMKKGFSPVYVLKGGLDNWPFPKK